jgi:molybdate transport system substrate-binding protein
MSPAVPAMPPLKAISSMATRALLAELAAACEAATGLAVAVESVGGVDAAKRVAASATTGEAFDLVFLASDALDVLSAGAHTLARADLVVSSIAVAVPAGAPVPDVNNGDAVRAAVAAAPSVGYSTGPSGTYLQGLFARWGLADAVAAKLVKPPPGTPVAHLIARGDVALGFQQVSELVGAPGVQVVGELPPDIAYRTTFSGAVAARSARRAEAARALAYLASATTADTRRRHGFGLPG